MCRGNPKFDEDGKITNAVVYCHGFDDDFSSINESYSIAREGGAFDEFDLCFISITSLGFPGSCSPSSTGLRYKFPKYTFNDSVNFKRKFLKEYFGMDHVFGLYGHGLGGYEVYTWACDFPDEMEFIIVGTSSFKTNGYRYVVAKGLDGVMEASDSFYSDVYDDSLSRIMVSINKILYSDYFSKNVFQSMSRDEIDVLMDEYVDDGLFRDIYDFKFRNDALMEYDVEDRLKNITAKALVFAPSDDVYYTPEFDTLPVKDLIEDVTICLFDSRKSFYEDADYSKVYGVLREFLEGLIKNRK